MEEGAATTGADVRPQDWRVVRDIFVADTDAEAKDWVRSEPVGRPLDTSRTSRCSARSTGRST